VVTEVAQVLERAAEAVPVLLVEQNLALVRRLATHCAVLADGRTVHRGPATALLADADALRRLLGVGRHDGGTPAGAQPRTVLEPTAPRPSAADEDRLAAAGAENAATGAGNAATGTGNAATGTGNAAGTANKEATP
jgi:branched-chain amino acid transport system ATP-binding protein